VRARLLAIGLLTVAIVASGGGSGRADWLAPARPTEHGFPADLSARIDSFVAENDLDLRAVLVVVDDRLVAERYYHGVTRGRFLHLYSATKSVTGMLVGIALADGNLTGVGETLAEALPAGLKARASGRIRATTVRELLSMTSGLGEELSWVTSADFAQAIVEHPFFAGPRGTFSYSSAGTQLVGAALERATGETLLSYARKKLFVPLGIVTEPRGEGHPGLRHETVRTFGWAHDAHGHYVAGTWLRLRGIDMAKLGLLYLHGGEWEGKRVVPRSWIDAMTQPRSDGGWPELAPYGFLTWLPTEAGRKAFLMAGYGGQYIEVVPSLRLVIVTSSPTRPTLATRAILTYIVGLARGGRR
jgi:CubicO group peptidase (beta-lactamase class C family)